MREQSENAKGVGGAKVRLERWRKEHGGRGIPLPRELWAEAVELARVGGVAETARALRLDRSRLARRIGLDASANTSAGAGTPRGDGQAGDGFVELDMSRLYPSTGTKLRFESGHGERLEVELGAASAVDVVALAQAFWSRRR